MADSIATSIIETLKSFNDFIDSMRDPSTSNVEGLSIGRWEDELGRLHMWAANIGAHRIGQSSLDYRLRDASHIRQQILKLLDIVRRRLKDAGEILDGDSECDNDSSSDGEDSNPEEPSEMAQMLDSVATMISCLFQMSMLIRNPAKHDVRRESYRSEISAFAPYDFNHVREKFPKASELLTLRLGTAITQRRKYLSYRERHAAKLKQGLSSTAFGADTATMGGLSDTIATDPQQRNIKFDDLASDSGLSQTSYAPTLKGGGNIIIPPAPRASHNGAPFECPFCYHVIALTRGYSWAKHVFQDLQPYVCLEPDCKTPHKMYTNRREWIYHMRNVHDQIEKQERPESETLSPCPLCDLVCVSRAYLDKHVARHMQELALFVLPQDDEDLNGDSSSREVHSSSADSPSGNESFDDEGKHSVSVDPPKPKLTFGLGAHATAPKRTAGSISEFMDRFSPRFLPPSDATKDKTEARDDPTSALNSSFSDSIALQAERLAEKVRSFGHRQTPEGSPLLTPSRHHDEASPIPVPEPNREEKRGLERIYFACGRCRWMKMKCTGDLDQDVCDRCKLAGFGPSDCQLPEIPPFDPALIRQPGVPGSVDLNEDVDTAGLRTRTPSYPESPISGIATGVAFRDFEPSSLEDIAESKFEEQVMKDEQDSSLKE